MTIQVNASLGARDALKSDDLFVGRRLAVQSCAGLGEQLKLVWIWGPRKVGKSSLAEKLGRDFRRRYDGAQVMRFDASQMTELNELLEVVLKSIRPADRKGSPRERFERFANSTRAQAPILLVLDDIDRLAIRLQLEEQAFLRRLTGEGRNLSYVFVTRVDPARIVEEVSDVASRLLGIAKLERVGMLEIGDIDELVGRVAKAIGWENTEAVSKSIWGAIGGHPVSVVTILSEIACQPVFDDDVLVDALVKRRGELLHQLKRLWHDLSPGTRSLLLESAAEADPYCSSEAFADGFKTRRGVHRPDLLMQAATAEPPSAGADSRNNLEAVVRLHDRIAEVNTVVKSRGNNGWFSTIDEVRRFDRALRDCSTELEFQAFVNHLHKVVYESARMPQRVGSHRLMWRMPQAFSDILWRSKGVRGLVTLRNFYSHAEQSTDAEHVPEGYRNAGEVFAGLCGLTRPQRATEWTMCQASLLGELCKALDELLAKLHGSLSAEGLGTLGLQEESLSRA